MNELKAHSSNYDRSSTKTDSDDENNRINNPTLAALAKKTDFISKIASITTLNEKEFEPLPFTDNSEFNEKYNADKLTINQNLLDDVKYVFLPGVPIKVKVLAHRRKRHHFLNQFNYLIQFKHDKYTWSVSREYNDLKEIHKTLSKIVKKDIGRSCSEISVNEINPEWPLFPANRDHHVSNQHIEERCKNIAEYLERLLKYPPYRDHPLVLNFMCVSPISFIKDISQSLIEDYLYKHTYENIYFGHMKQIKKCCGQNFKFMNHKRWFCIKDTYITYLNQKKNNSVGFTMLVDHKFLCKKKIKAGAYHAIEIKNCQRTLVLKFKKSQQQKEWYSKIMLMLQTTGRYFYDSELLLNGSYAPRREKQKCKWYINAALYMENLMTAINNAKEEIFITDWWLCPELYLKRPTYNLNHRLDKLLYKKSKENVKIYILLYKEIDILLGLSSERAKSVLTQNGKNKNIKIILHPKNNAPNFSMWSHHEKIVVIDQSLAFLGGIDLCFGRWDDDDHRLVDVHKNNDQIDLKKYPFSADSINYDLQNNILDFDNAIRAIITTSALTCNLASNLNNNTSENVEEAVLTFNKLNTLESENVKEVSKTDRIKKKFKRLKTKLKERKIYESYTSSSSSDNESLKPSDAESEFSDNEIETDPKIEIRYWLGKDYANSYKEDFKDIQDFAKDQFDRNEVPRMPWRDQGLVIFGESARDLARHFVQRWNQAKHEIENQNPSYPFILPKSYTEPIEDYSNWFNCKDINTCSIQILRSLNTWSGGLSHTECSILNAYCDLINKAKHYIYIENQFFVTTTNSRKDNFVKNQIGACLVERILRAHKDGQNFRVFVVIPLFPGFDNLNAILAVQYYNLRSIKFGEYSIYNELERNGIKDPTEYITFHGMRNWSVLMGKLVQEIIYVHSKLMIVDDLYVICGSANINDRSMLGKRDSEIAGLVMDEEFLDSVLNNEKVKVGKYAFSLRTKIFKLHLGIYFKNPNQIDVTDCVCDEFYKNFRLVSQRNTTIYDDIFKCLPSDNVSNCEELKTYTNRTCLNKTDPIKAKSILENNIMGFIVDFPLKFLSNEKNFFPSIITAEGMVPSSTWT